jgi:hypothetical protein
VAPLQLLEHLLCFKRTLFRARFDWWLLAAGLLLLRHEQSLQRFVPELQQAEENQLRMNWALSLWFNRR